MADGHLAAKAPESDAHQDPPNEVPGDSTVDQGAASLGRHCTTDRPLPAGEHPSGEIAIYNHVETYIAKPADYPHTPCRLLLLLTGGTGIRSPNNQLQADKFASEGFLVAMPDQFAGDPATAIATTDTSPAAPNPSVIEQVKMGIASVAKSFTIDMWLARHTPETVLPLLHRAIDGIAQAFADAVAYGGGIYGVGYCFGAKYILQLGAPRDAAGAEGPASCETGAAVPNAPRIKCGAIAHGTQITVADLERCRVPLSVVAVQGDGLFPDEVREDGVKKLREMGVEHEEKLYPGVPHGFAVLGEYADAAIREKQRDAFQQILAWLKSH